ncbi:MAG: hypothetical protein V1928_05630 [Parcubacteria group bacterium]
MTINQRHFILLLIIAVCLIGNLNLALADDATTQAIKNANDAIGRFPEDMPKSDDISGYAGKALYQVLGIIGTIALLVFLYGGIMWMTAAGKLEQVNTAKDTMIWAAIGLFAIFASYSIILYLISNFNF